MAAEPETITFDDFLRVDIRVGTIIGARLNEAARRPSLALEIDFGSALGVRTSSAQITEHYTPDVLIGRQVAAVTNFPPKQIAKVRSEVLVLGFADAEGRIVLIGPDHPVPDGSRLH